jgi:predicted PurR-regulated permease PerM
MVGIIGGLIFALVNEIISLAQNINSTLDGFIRYIGNITANIQSKKGNH